MTRTAHFADHALTSETFAVRGAQATPFLARKSQGTTVEPSPAVSFSSNPVRAMEGYPWLTATTLRNMSVRAQRLMRMGY